MKHRMPEEMRDISYRFGVVPTKFAECQMCGNWPAMTGHKNFPRLWLFKSREASSKFRETGECQTCQEADDDRVTGAVQ
jgi:hypothetical protein